MLKEYNKTVINMSDIDKKLLETKIVELNKALEPGRDSLNLCSLGISSFISKCNSEINSFKDLKRNVSKSA